MLNSELTIAIVISTFNQEITNQLLAETRAQLIRDGILEKNLTILTVPGAIEIPLMTKLLARSKKYHAIITLGAVIRGDTSHYDYVCQQVSQGCQQVMMEFDLPVIFGVLTTENIEQAQVRVQGPENKGIEAAKTAIHMAKLVLLY